MPQVIYRWCFQVFKYACVLAWVYKGLKRQKPLKVRRGNLLAYTHLFHSSSFSLQALNGFIMMTTQTGKLLYISDNAAEYLGHSMVSNHYSLVTKCIVFLLGSSYILFICIMCCSQIWAKNLKSTRLNLCFILKQLRELLRELFVAHLIQQRRVFPYNQVLWLIQTHLMSWSHMKSWGG